MTTTPTPNDCCNSGDDLYIKIERRVKDCQDHPTQPNHCYWIDLKEGYALSPTTDQVPNLLVPTKCIQGIECPEIWKNDTPNYWHLAWENLAKVHLRSHLDSIGMAINAKLSQYSTVPTRHHEQLHIHVRQIDNKVQTFLHQTHDSGIKTPPNWEILQIKDPKGEERNYRVLKIMKDDDLKNYNLFKLVYQEVKNAGDMQYQTLIVAKRPGGGFYILNSDTISHSLNPGGTRGIGDGERLLYPPPPH